MKTTAFLSFSALLAFGAGSIASASNTTPSLTDLRSWFGTYDCQSPQNPHVTIMTPLLGGKIMRVSGNGKGASESLVGFDPKRNLIIDEFYDQAGTYVAYEGPVKKNAINLTAVYPAGTVSTIVVHRISVSRYHTDFTLKTNGKTTFGFEDCRKR